MKRLALLVAMLFVAAVPAQAAINLAGYTFDDNAFADYLHSYVGAPVAFDYVVGWYATTTFQDLENCTTGPDVNSAAILQPGSGVTLGFSDNVIFNGFGSDFVLFETEVPASAMVEVQLGGFTQLYSSVASGYFNDYGMSINVVEVDLDDFGFAAGAYADLITLYSTPGQYDDSFDLTAIGALNSTQPIPEPGTLALVGLGLAGLGAIRRRKSR